MQSDVVIALLLIFIYACLGMAVYFREMKDEKSKKVFDRSQLSKYMTYKSFCVTLGIFWPVDTLIMIKWWIIDHVRDLKKRMR